MALSHAQILKRKARKDKARAEKAKAIQQESHLRYRSQWPIVAAYAPFEARDDYSLQNAIIVRQRPDGQYAVALFLIDVLCLGVKESFLKIMPSCQFAALLEKIEDIMPMDVVSPSYVATFVYKAVEYAENLGLDPRGDYKAAKKILEDISLDLSLSFTFGNEDGEPVYIAGVRDSREFADTILEKLDKAVGRDHYKYIVPVKGAE